MSIPGVVFNMQRFSLHDGPGIRTLVFLKGCRLHCRWCCNPESMKPKSELAFFKERCDKCTRCLAACSIEAIALDHGKGTPVIDRGKCTGCGECAKVCNPNALVVYGGKCSAGEVLEEVRRDSRFYSSSNGGVTVSGGEPLLQFDFVIALFRLCHDAGISTAFESCGEVEARALRDVLKHTDLAIYDIKCIDPIEHQKLTGRRNERILDNAKIVVESGVAVRFRMPLIPGLTSTPDNIRAAAQFLRNLQKGDACIELMPYHGLGIGKYEALGRTYPLAGLKDSPGYVETAKKLFEEGGVRCLVSG